MKNLTLVIISALLVILTSCDAMLTMSYSVENKSKTDVKLFIPNFPVEGVIDIFNNYKDTILTLHPNQRIYVSSSSKIDFPWATKNIYKNHPGVCGLKIIENNSAKSIGCTNKEWKYKRRASNLKIKRK
jgi:hypothetical protein